MELTRKTQDFIQQHALSEHPNECCGIVTNLNDEQAPIRCSNLSKNKINEFSLEIKNRNNIAFYYHSHAEKENFSLTDKLISEKTGIKSILYVVKNNNFLIYEPKGEIISFTGRPFVRGILDCSELVKDFFERTFNIYIPEIRHEVRFLDINEENNWENLKHYNESKDEFLKNFYLDNGFSEIDKNKCIKNNSFLLRGDLILVRTPKLFVPVHVAVYLENNKILHHPRDRYSLEEEYDLVYKRMTTNILRHKTLSE